MDLNQAYNLKFIEHASATVALANNHNSLHQLKKKTKENGLKKTKQRKTENVSL